jgi:CHAD domain-containing protein
MTCDVEDIHKARVDIKKLNALFILFDNMAPGFTRKTGGHRLFRNLFKRAGTIREIQLILLFLEKKNDLEPVLLEFQKWILKKNNTQIRQYLQSVISFDRNELKALNRSVKKLISGVGRSQLIINSWDIIEKCSIRIKYLLTGWNDPRYIHRIRQNVKAMAAIANQVSQVTRVSGLNHLRPGLVTTEIAIGEWHDKVVIINSMEQFMKTTHYLTAGSHNHFQDIKDQLVRENGALLEKIEPEITGLMLLVRKLAQNRSIKENRSKY